MKFIIFILILTPFVNYCSSKDVNQEVIETLLPLELVSINTFPENYQLYARDSYNKALIPITGTAESVVDSLIIKVHQNNGGITRTAFHAVNSFSLKIEIEAILYNYTIELFSKLKEEETLVASATNVTAGDVYVISGQSNAWATDWDNIYNDENLPPNAQWVRTIGAMHVYNKPAIYPEAKNTDWYLASGKAPVSIDGGQLIGNAMIGVLGMNVGVNLVKSEGVPIAIINGAGGGGAISFYQKTENYDLDVPYGRLQYRLEASGLKDKIKAFIWNQGENNAGDDVIYFKKALNNLYMSLKEDYYFEKFYVIQTPPGCNSKSGHQTIREAQRRFVEENENVNIITRHGFSTNPKTLDGNYFISDGCHYHAHGYEVLADWIANKAKYDFYGDTLDYEAPKVISAKLVSSASLVVEFDKAVMIQPDLFVDGVLYSIKDNLFAINNIRTTSISKIEVLHENKKEVRLTFSDRTISIGDTLTYVLNDNYPSTSITYRGPWIVDFNSGVGAIGFTITIE